MRGLAPTQAPKNAGNASLLLRRAATLPRVWHLLSLDAPTVAATWCIAFWKSTGGPSGGGSLWFSVAFLSLATWLCYVVDRTLDARATLCAPDLRARHHFYGRLWRRRRKSLLGALCLAALLCAASALKGLSASLFVDYLALTSISLAYFFLVHSRQERGRRLLAKEAAVAIIFALGCILPAFCRVHLEQRRGLVPLGALFAMLCWLNCVAIERWEGEGTVSARAHVATRWAAHHLLMLSCSGAAMAFLFGLLDRAHESARILAPCLTAAFVLLAALERARRRLSAETLRIAADAALLTPLVWWFAAL